MTIDGHFLEGHCKGFDDGVAAGWEAGYLRALQDIGVAPTGPVPEPSGVDYVPPVHDLTDRLEDLLRDDHISIRAFNCLTREGIHTIGEIAHKTEEQLKEIRNMGEKTIGEVKTLLYNRGLALRKSGKGAANA